MNFYQALEKQSKQEINNKIKCDLLHVTKVYNTLILYRNRKLTFMTQKDAQPQNDFSAERDKLSKIKEYSINEIKTLNFQECRYFMNILQEEQRRIGNLKPDEYDFREDLIMKEVNKFTKKTVAQKLPKNIQEK